MHSVFDLLVLLVFFAPIAILVAINLFTYRAPFELSAPRKPVAMAQSPAAAEPELEASNQEGLRQAA